MGRRKYIYRNSWPKGGPIFIDSCGAAWMPKSFGPKAELERLKDFNRRNRDRKDAFVVKSIFDEIGVLVSGLVKRRGLLKQVGGCEEELCFVESRINEYSRFRGIFFENYSSVNLPGGRIPREEIEIFYDGYNIHDGEKAALVRATFFEGDNGFVSSDNEALLAYYEALRTFGISGFVCDAKNSRVRGVRERRFYRCG